MVLEFVRRCKRPEVLCERTSASRVAALLVIGVKPRCQNQGVGQSMMEGFEGLILSKGFTGVSLSTFTDNKVGNRTFQRAGYVLYRTDDGTNYNFKHLTEEVGDYPMSNSVYHGQFCGAAQRSPVLCSRRSFVHIGFQNYYPGFLSFLTLDTCEIRDNRLSLRSSFRSLNAKSAK